MFEILGYIASLFIGISLGLIGGGGSILTVPVLVYLFGINPVLATAYSLFIVGISSLVGVYPKYKEGLVNIKTAFVFGMPSIAAVFLTRKFIVPAIPDYILSISGFEITKSLLLMVLFAVLMLFASFSMINNNPQTESTDKKFGYGIILLEGFVVGTLTGLVGAGGGFLIIPALVLLTKTPMKEAVGTSLLIIAAKSIIGFTGDISNIDIDWLFLSTISVIAIAGIFIGNYFSKLIDGNKLKKGFGWFVLVMGVYILIKEIFLK